MLSLFLSLILSLFFFLSETTSIDQVLGNHIDSSLLKHCLFQIQTPNRPDRKNRKRALALNGVNQEDDETPIKLVPGMFFCFLPVNDLQLTSTYTYNTFSTIFCRGVFNGGCARYARITVIAKRV